MLCVCALLRKKNRAKKDSPFLWSQLWDEFWPYHKLAPSDVYSIFCGHTFVKKSRQQTTEKLMLNGSCVGQGKLLLKPLLVKVQKVAFWGLNLNHVGIILRLI